MPERARALRAFRHLHRLHWVVSIRRWLRIAIGQNRPIVPVLQSGQGISGRSHAEKKPRHAGGVVFALRCNVALRHLLGVLIYRAPSAPLAPFCPCTRIR